MLGSLHQQQMSMCKGKILPYFLENMTRFILRWDYWRSFQGEEEERASLINHRKTWKLERACNLKIIDGINVDSAIRYVTVQHFKIKVKNSCKNSIYITFLMLPLPLIKTWGGHIYVNWGELHVSRVWPFTQLRNYCSFYFCKWWEARRVLCTGNYKALCYWMKRLVTFGLWAKSGWSPVLVW